MTDLQAMLASLMNDGDDEPSFSIFDFVRQDVRNKPNVPLAKIRDVGDYVFSNTQCLGCGKQSTQTCRVKFVRCSRCKYAMYCGKTCQIADYKGHGKGATQPRSHKELCPELVEINAEFENHPTAGPTLLRTELFKSWANQHCADGSFYYHEFLARRNILGGSKVGFWAQMEPSMTSQPTGPFHASGADSTGFRNGQMLLEKSFPKLAKGWTSSLKANEYPSSGPPKKALPAQGLLGWKDYLEFRGLSPTTIAPLLLNKVLTIYQMIYHELKLHEKKKPLKVSLLGVEIELNQIPLFEELLYLLPAGVDLELVLVSLAVKDVCDQAAKLKSETGKTVIASQEYVLDLTDPVAKGRVRVKLHANDGFYHEIPFENSNADAVLALGAGLGSYESWNDTVHKILRLQIPFVITDQCKITLLYNEKCWFPWLMARIRTEYQDLPFLHMPTFMQNEAKSFPRNCQPRRCSLGGAEYPQRIHYANSL